MTLNQLASLIAKREGKKSQAHIGDVREILKTLYTLDAEESLKVGGKDLIESLSKLSNKHANKLAKKQGKGQR